MVTASEAAPIFVVDWTTVWSSSDEVTAAYRALAEASARMTARGVEVRCLHSVFVASEARWICLFAAPDESAAQMLAAMAQIPQRFIRVGVDLMVLAGNRS